ncbi:hypothetical protein EGT50_07255 [Rhodococcus xishaensis]|uniref:Uncharacterized protein n=1 Tax=Rhodococcus xishaensis TaxID=2487364 RepID=A0A3S3CS01_9NOCA|nr:hypothetical protein EGT50_07255 [Rhodococcus xishaensis]
MRASALRRPCQHRPLRRWGPPGLSPGSLEEPSEDPSAPAESESDPGEVATGGGFKGASGTCVLSVGRRMSSPSTGTAPSVFPESEPPL